MITGINHITLAVKDVGKSFDFYVNVLNFTPIVRWPEGAYLKTGGIWVALLYEADITDRPRPDYTHIALSCRQKDFSALRVKILETGVLEWQENRTEGDSLYFCDPNGHKLELHAGDLDSRLRDMKTRPGKDYEYFNPKSKAGSRRPM